MEIFSHCHLFIFAKDYIKVTAIFSSQTRSPAGPRGPVTHKKQDFGGLLWVGLCDLSLNIKKTPQKWHHVDVAETSCSKKED